MQDTFQWTDELVQEFVQFTLHQSPAFQGRYTDMEQFKSSKSPKKEWEIVAYCFQPLKGLDKPVLVTQGSKYWERALSEDKDFPIRSVRRLSDGEVFSVGDRITGGIIQKIDTTTSSMDGIMFRTANVSKPISCAEKLPQPILTSDGAEISNPETEIWVLEEDTIGHFYAEQAMKDTDRFKGMQIFSTRQTAEEYILNNRPLLSLNDVKEVCDVPGMRVSAQTDILIEKLTTLVKQKLNQ